jgi:predicted esterase
MLAASLEYIVQEIGKLMNENTTRPEDLVIIGHSQGGIMAILAGEILGAGKVITLAADVFPGIEPPGKNKNMKIHWFEAGGDGKLNIARKSSYKILENLGYNIHHQLVLGATHSVFPTDIVNKVL